MNEYRVSFRYARAVLDLAKQEGIADTVLQDLQFIGKSLKQSRELRAFINNPVTLQTLKKKVLSEIFESKINKLTNAFIMLITDKGRESLLQSIAYQYEEQYNEQNNRMPVEIFTAQEIDELAQKNMCGRLAKWSGKTILPEFKVDKSLLGGVKIQLAGGRILDGSVQYQLSKMHKNLIEGGAL